MATIQVNINGKVATFFDTKKVSADKQVETYVKDLVNAWTMVSDITSLPKLSVSFLKTDGNSAAELKKLLKRKR